MLNFQSPLLSKCLKSVYCSWSERSKPNSWRPLYNSSNSITLFLFLSSFLSYKMKSTWQDPLGRRQMKDNYQRIFLVSLAHEIHQPPWRLLACSSCNWWWIHQLSSIGTYRHWTWRLLRVRNPIIMWDGYLFDEEILSIRVLLTRSLEEFASPYTTISLCNLVNLNSVITTKELNNKSSVVLLLYLTDLSGFKSHNILILSEILSHILLRRFRLQWINRAYSFYLKFYPKNPLPIRIHCKEGFIDRT